MKNVVKIALSSLSLLGLASIAAPAMAQDAPAYALTGSLAVQSDYRFRGVSQNDKNVTPQGSLNLTMPDGWYVGTWASQTNWGLGGSDNPSIEVDIFGGKHIDLGDGLDLNVQAYGYVYPDAKTAGGPAASFFEGIFTLSKAFGPVAFAGTYAVSPEFSLGGGVSHYLLGNSTVTLNDWLTVSSNIGHQWVELAPTDYTHADVGATLLYQGLSLDLRYVTTSLSRANCSFYMGTAKACTAGFVATVSYTIPLL